MYTAASMPGETGPVASASLGSAIENGGRERLGQLWHPALKWRTATERLSVCGTGRHQSRDSLASIRNCDFVPLSNLSNQCRQVLPGFTYSCFFHPAIVLHVALACNCGSWRATCSPPRSKSLVPGNGSTRISRSLLSASRPCSTEPNRCGLSARFCVRQVGGSTDLAVYMPSPSRDGWLQLVGRRESMG